MPAMTLIRAGVIKSAGGGGGLPTFPAPSAVAHSATTANLAVWDAGLVTTGQADPAGGTEAVSITFNSTGTRDRSQYSIRGLPTTGAAFSFTAGTTYTYSVYAKQIGTNGRYLRFALYDADSGDAGVMYDLQTGTVGSSRAGGNTEVSPGITSVGSGWYQCYFSVTGLTGTMDNYQLGPAATDDSNFDANTTAATNDGVLVWRLQIVSGTNPNG